MHDDMWPGAHAWQYMQQRIAKVASCVVLEHISTAQSVRMHVAYSFPCTIRYMLNLLTKDYAPSTGSVSEQYLVVRAPMQGCQTDLLFGTDASFSCALQKLQIRKCTKKT